MGKKGNDHIPASILRKLGTGQWEVLEKLELGLAVSHRFHDKNIQGRIPCSAKAEPIKISNLQRTSHCPVRKNNLNTFSLRY